MAIGSVGFPQRPLYPQRTHCPRLVVWFNLRIQIRWRWGSPRKRSRRLLGPCASCPDRRRRCASWGSRLAALGAGMGRPRGSEKKGCDENNTVVGGGGRSEVKIVELKTKVDSFLNAISSSAWKYTRSIKESSLTGRASCLR
nr:uncharacterized protein LOC127302109 isoform X2 [Lolium perenne]